MRNFSEGTKPPILAPITGLPPAGPRRAMRGGRGRHQSRGARGVENGTAVAPEIGPVVADSCT